MARHNHNLFRMFAPLQIRDDVITDCVRQSLRRQYQPHSHFSFTRKMGDKIGILRSDGGCGNLRSVVGISQSARMRQTIVRAAGGSIERRNRSQASCGTSANAAIDHCLPISLALESVVGQPLIESRVEEHDFARDAITTECFQLVKVIDHHNLGS